MSTHALVEIGKRVQEALVDLGHLFGPFFGSTTSNDEKKPVKEKLKWRLAQPSEYESILWESAPPKLEFLGVGEVILPRFGLSPRKKKAKSLGTRRRVARLKRRRFP